MSFQHKETQEKSVYTMVVTAQGIAFYLLHKVITYGKFID